MYYPFGNSIAEDLLLNHPDAKDVLLIGCGDVRHVLYTLQEMKRKGLNQKVSFTMNDIDRNVIARNCLILYGLGDPDLKIDHLTQFWYSLFMDDSAHSYWMKKIKECLNVNLKFEGIEMDSDTRTKISQVFQAWLDCSWSKKAVQKKRKAYESLYQVRLKELRNGLPANFINFDERMKKQWSREFQEYLQSRSFQNGSKINPSLMFAKSDGSFLYALHYGTFPFEGHRFDPKFSLQENIANGLKGWFHGFLQMPCVIHLNCDDALGFCDQIMKKTEQKFDLIESSNLFDHLGVLNVTFHASILLRDEMSILKACSFIPHHSGAKNTEEYLYNMTGLTVDVFPTLLGVIPITSSDHWSTQVCPFVGSQELNFDSQGARLRRYAYMHFKKASFPIAPITLTPYLQDQLINCLTETVVNYNEKLKPLLKNTTPSFFGKMLGLGAAQGSIPFDDPVDLFKKILHKRLFAGTMAEMFNFCYVYGFKCNSDDEFSDRPYLVSHIFRPSEILMTPIPTPIYFVYMEHAGLSYYISSARFTDLPNGKLNVTFVLSGFVKDWDPQTTNFSIWYGSDQPVSVILPTTFQDVTLSEMKLVPCDRDMELIKACTIEKSPNHATNH
jgi:hypothetical protein